MMKRTMRQKVILAKNRNGPVGTIEMYFAGQFTLFYELTQPGRTGRYVSHVRKGLSVWIMGK